MAKMTVKKLKRMFKDANEVRSVQYSRFNMKDFDLESIYYDAERQSFYITDKEGNDHKELHDVYNNLTAEIIN